MKEPWYHKICGWGIVIFVEILVCTAVIIYCCMR